MSVANQQHVGIGSQTRLTVKRLRSAFLVVAILFTISYQAKLADAQHDLLDTW
jgi:hypothetical protein